MAAIYKCYLYRKDLFCPLGKYQLAKTQRNLTSYSQKCQGDEEIYTPVHARCQSHGPSSDPTRENFTQDQPGHWNRRREKKKKGVVFERMTFLAVNWGSPWVQVRLPERIRWFSGSGWAQALEDHPCSPSSALQSASPRGIIPAWRPATGPQVAPALLGSASTHGTRETQKTLETQALTAHLCRKGSPD